MSVLRDHTSREYPARPIVGVAGLALDAGNVLLIRRGRPPLQGAWSLPGGALRTGERIVDGIAREILEETSLVVVPVRQIATLERIVHDAEGRVQFHYVLIDWLCRLAPGHTLPRAGGDALEVSWVSPSALESCSGLERITMDLIGQTLLEESQL